jgi:hypothetical protein
MAISRTVCQGTACTASGLDPAAAHVAVEMSSTESTPVGRQGSSGYAESFSIRNDDEQPGTVQLTYCGPDGSLISEPENPILDRAVANITESEITVTADREEDSTGLFEASMSVEACEVVRMRSRIGGG